MMPKSPIDSLIVTSLKASVALLPLMMGSAFAPAYAQPTQAPAAQDEQATDDSSEFDTKTVGAASTKEKDEDEKAVVVTGTSIRNAPPTGTNLIQMDKEGIKATGANSAQELLSNLPQTGSFFNELPQLEGQGASPTSGVTLKPNARGIPGNDATDSGSSTLILLDGQRMAGTGTINNAPDINSIPVALLDRVEVNTDGGSSIYGSDGIGGVINFVTRRRFDGVQVRGRYGIADDYDNYEVGGIIGHDFGKLNAYISFSRTGNSLFLNGDRDYYQVIDWDTGLETGTACSLPNVRYGTGAGARYYGTDGNGNIATMPGSIVSGLVTQVTSNGITSPNLCTPDLNASFTPKQVRNNVLASIAYDFTDDIKLAVRGRYADSKSTTYPAPFTQTITLDPANPSYRPVAGEVGNQAVLFSFLPAAGVGSYSSYRKFKQYGISPELTVNIDQNWQVRAFVNWEKSETLLGGNAIDNAALTPAVASGAFDPYDVAGTDPALLADILDGFQGQGSFDEILNARVTVDGALLELPGGKVRIAAGAEYLKDSFGLRGPAGATDSDTLENLPYDRKAHRDIKSVFGEINIPIVSSLNSGPLFQELRFAFSGRYDSYSDFGNNFSPRIGATYAPFKWLRFRGNWGKSFRAPTVIETLQSQSANASRIPGSSGLIIGGLQDPARPSNNPSGETVILYFGVPSPDLRPQTGTNWSVAGEIRPIEGLRAELSYYKIDYRNRIGFPPFLQPAFYPAFAHLTDVYPCGPTTPGTCTAVDDFLSIATNRDQILADLATSGEVVYATIDGRTTNIGSSKIEGLDYSARYDFNIGGIGAAYVSVNGNVQLVSKTKQFVTSTPINDLNQVPNNRTSVTAGLRSGGFRTQLTLNHTDGFKVLRTATLHQDSVDAFNVVNAFFAYEFNEGELGLGTVTKGLEVTFGIQNVFDAEPPIFRQDGQPAYYQSVGTLGRLFQFGVTKNF